jgi:very-short-patch-repair endonuclease/uncharacterized Zn-finger protein
MDKIKRKVVKCDLSGNIVSEFNTLVEAGIEIGVTKHTIFKCCKNQKKIVNEHTYHYVEIIENTIEIIKPIKCPYCDRTFDSYNGLCKHIIKGKMHGEISKEKLLSDYKYDGKRPICACGCGNETEIGYIGGTHFNEMIKGHYSMMHNNWGHNQKAIDNSAKTRRSRFKSGEIEQWNKGKNWDETYNQEQKDSLLEVYKDPIRNKKISEGLTGVPKSPEHAEKIRITKRTPEARENQRNILMSRINNQSFKISSKAEDDFSINFLDELNIVYERQKYIKDIKQYCDFYIPNNKAFIEFDGDYYHCNPVKFPNGPINEMQEKKIEKDKIKNKWMSDNHKTIIHIWENDAKNNKELVLKLLEPLLD